MAGESIIAILLHELAIIWYDDAIVGALSFSPPSHLNAWLRHSVCSFVCRFLQAACEVGSSRQESKPSAVPCLILLLYAFFFYWIFYFSLFYNPFKNPPPTFPVESYTHKVFPFLVEWATFFVSTDEQILNLSTSSEYNASFKVLATLLTKFGVFRYMTPCWLVNG